jgi:predicted HAD superfamily Cof-like phosphohydrolase
MVKEDFLESIKQFNEMYGMPINQRPTIPSLKRLKDLKSILQDELDELDKISEKYEAALEGIDCKQNPNSHLGWEEFNEKIPAEKKVEILTDLADLLGDLIVYVSSESKKYGIEIDEVLKIIMKSNFSKLGADGKPIKDERGYIVKGPNYFKPEPKISEYLKDKLNQ